MLWLALVGSKKPRDVVAVGLWLSICWHPSLQAKARRFCYSCLTLLYCLSLRYHQNQAVGTDGSSICQSLNSRSLNIYHAKQADHNWCEHWWLLKENSVGKNASLQNGAIISRARHLPEYVKWQWHAQVSSDVTKCTLETCNLTVRFQGDPSPFSLWRLQEREQNKNVI